MANPSDPRGTPNIYGDYPVNPQNTAPQFDRFGGVVIDDAAENTLPQRDPPPPPGYRLIANGRRNQFGDMPIEQLPPQKSADANVPVQSRPGLNYFDTEAADPEIYAQHKWADRADALLNSPQRAQVEQYAAAKGVPFQPDGAWHGGPESDRMKQDARKLAGDYLRTTLPAPVVQRMDEQSKREYHVLSFIDHRDKLATAAIHERLLQNPQAGDEELYEYAHSQLLNAGLDNSRLPAFTFNRKTGVAQTDRGLVMGLLARSAGVLVDIPKNVAEFGGRMVNTGLAKGSQAAFGENSDITRSYEGTLQNYNAGAAKIDTSLNQFFRGSTYGQEHPAYGLVEEGLAQVPSLVLLSGLGRAAGAARTMSELEAGASAAKAMQSGARVSNAVVFGQIATQEFNNSYKKIYADALANGQDANAASDSAMVGAAIDSAVNTYAMKYGLLGQKGGVGLRGRLVAALTSMPAQGGVSGLQEYVRQFSSYALTGQNPDLEAILHAAAAGGVTGGVGGFVMGSHAQGNPRERAAAVARPEENTKPAQEYGEQPATPPRTQTLPGEVPVITDETLKSLVTNPTPPTAPFETKGVGLIEKATPKYRVQKGAESKGLPMEFEDPIEKLLWIGSQHRNGKLKVEAVRDLKAKGFDDAAIAVRGDELAKRVDELARGATGDTLRIPKRVGVPTAATPQEAGVKNVPTVEAPVSEVIPKNLARPATAATSSLPKLVESAQPAYSTTAGGDAEKIPVQFEHADDKAVFLATAAKRGKIAAEAAEYLKGKGLTPQQIEQAGTDLRVRMERLAKDNQLEPGDKFHVPAAGTEAAKAIAIPDTALRAAPERQAVNSRIVPDVAKAEADLPNIRPEARIVKPSRYVKAASAAVEQVLGVKVVHVNDEGGAAGFTNPAHPGVVFIDARYPVKGWAKYFAHEWLHVVQDTDPTAAKAFLDAIPEAKRAEYLEQYKQQLAKMKGIDTAQYLTPEVAEREVAAMAMTDAATRSSVRRLMLGQKAGVWEKIVELGQGIWDKLTGKHQIVDRAIGLLREKMVTPQESTGTGDKNNAAVEAPPAGVREGGPSAKRKGTSFLPYGHWLSPKGAVEDVDSEGHAEFARMELGKLSAEDTVATTSLLDKGWVRVVNIGQSALGIEVRKPLTPAAVKSLRPLVERTLDNGGEVRIERTGDRYETGRVTSLRGWNETVREYQQKPRVAPREADPAGTLYAPKGSERVQGEAEDYTKAAGVSYVRRPDYVEVNVERAKKIAAAYDTAKHDPTNPEVKAAYEAFKKETLDQWKYLESKGVKFEAWNKDGQPYKSSEAMRADVTNNKHLYFYQGGDLPADHPLAAKAPGTELTYNDVFRAVHDYFGHTKEGVGFGPRGEENAWRSHSAMYSDLARRAMTTETRGQNSWINYGPNGEHNQAKPAETIYAEQKATLLPAEYSRMDQEGPQTRANSFLPPDEEAKLREAGYEIRNTPHGQWVLPSGKGLSPTNNRGIVNHYEAAFDAGFITQGKARSDTVGAVNGLLKRGWLRIMGLTHFQTWGLPDDHVKVIEDHLQREYRFTPGERAYIDDAQTGRSYMVRLDDLAENKFDLRKSLRTGQVFEGEPGRTSFAPGEPTQKGEDQKAVYTSLKPEWYGRTLYDWGRGNVMLKAGERLTGPSGREGRNFPPAWRQQFSHVDAEAKSLLEEVKSRTDEILPVEGSGGGYVLAPKAAIEQAKRALAEKGIDPEADVAAAAEARRLRKISRSASPDESANLPESDIPARVRPNDKIAFYPSERFIKDDLKPAAEKVGAMLKSAWTGIKSIVGPHLRSDQAQYTADVLRERGAELAQRHDRLNEALGESRKFFGKLDTPVTRDFIENMEKGQRQTNPALQPTADALRSLLNDRLNQVQALGTGKLAAFIQDYFPHLWKDPTKATSVYANAIAKAPLEGKKGWMRQRTLKLFSDGLAKGLEPVTENPVEAVMLRVREMDKYITIHQAFQEMGMKGVLRRVRASDPLPTGYAKINDNIATVYAKPSRRGAIQIKGYIAAPEPVANVINNYLSPGIRGDKNFGGLFRAYLGAGNVMNQVQLGMSGFHLLNTTLDSATSKLSLALKQAGSGQFAEAGKSTLSAATMIGPAIGNIHKGSLILREWVKPGSTTPEIAEVVDAMKAAGGRIKMDDFYHTGMTERMLEAFKKGNWIGAAWRLPFAGIEQSAKPIMEHIVPRMKMGVFHDMARYELSKLEPAANREQVRAAMRKAWDSVDNRMGELVYDNLFWNKAVKDLAMASTRSVGWNLGTLRELAGGVADLGTMLKRAAIDRSFGNTEFTHRMAYTAAMPVMAGLIGGMIHYALGNGVPKEFKDWFFPKTGEKDKEGHDIRLALPSYMKDVLAYGKDPAKTLSNKVHPMLNTIMEMLSNEDYYGTKIRNEDDPWWKQVRDEAKFVGEQFTPLGVREASKLHEEGQGARSLLPFLGIVQARHDITRSPAELKAAELMREQMPRGSRTSEEADRAKLVRDLADSLRNHEPDARENIRNAFQSRQITESGIEQIRGRQKFPEMLQRSIRHLDLPDSIKVWDVADAEEKRKIAPLMFAKVRSSKSITKDQRVAYMQRLQADWRELRGGPIPAMAEEE